MRIVAMFFALSVLSFALHLPTPMGAAPHVPGLTTGYWEEAMLMSMTLDEKIGQLFMAPAYSQTTRYGQENAATVERLVRDHKIGGVIFMQGGPKAQAQMAKRLQAASDIPLLVGTDAEWGLSMRLNVDSVLTYPHNMTLGAIDNDSLLQAFGRRVADECKAVGVHVNFAPVVDVNNNPRNPVINDRSFGEDKYRVTHNSTMVMRGMQEHGVMASAKHFPGHGDTDKDSHFDLPTISHKRDRLNEVELHPFEHLIREGVLSVMVAHLFVPALDATANLPATLSRPIVTGVLRDSLGFKGLVFTDALGMKGVTKHFATGEIEVRALEAGCDILLMSENVPMAMDAVRKAVQSGRIKEEDLDAKVRRILAAKAMLILDPVARPDAPGVAALRNEDGRALQERLYREAVTLAANRNGLLPLRSLADRRIACVQHGSRMPAPFYQTLRKYGPVDFYHLSPTPSRADADSLLRKLQAGGYNTVIVGLFDLNKSAGKRYGLASNTLEFLRDVQEKGMQTVVVAFATPYCLRLLEGADALLAGYEEHPAAQQAAAEIIFGAASPKGTLPVSLDGKFDAKPFYAYKAGRLAQARPEELGLDSEALQRIDTIAQYWINERAMPGCAVLVARGNSIVYAKGFGQTEYANGRPVDAFETVYDLASITKIAATTLAVMRLYERDSIVLDAPVSRYWPEVNADLGALTIRQLLLHRSGLPAYLPFYEGGLKGKRLNPSVLSKRRSEHFDIPVAAGLYLHHNYPNEIWRKIALLKPKSEATPEYSDINMMIVAHIIERMTGRSLEAYVGEHFYRPMGMNMTCFNPAVKGRVVAPSEVDDYFRKERVEGYVNDENAAMLGGVAGHAGLFSNAFDLAKLMLMLKSGGRYGGEQFLKKETIDLFTARAGNDYRRGLGFDKPEPEADKITPTPRAASDATFGHLGFTGTAIWADPASDLIFIILANRTFPDRNNQLYVRASVRTKTFEAVYQAMDAYQQKRNPLAY